MYKLVKTIWTYAKKLQIYINKSIEYVEITFREQNVIYATNVRPFWYVSERALHADLNNPPPKPNTRSRSITL